MGWKNADNTTLTNDHSKYIHIENIWWECKEM